MLRELQGFTQNELAHMTGINQSNISALESNQRQMGRERAIILAKAFPKNTLKKKVACICLIYQSL